MDTVYNMSVFSFDTFDKGVDNIGDGTMLTDSARNYFFLINHVVISTFICLFGIVGNCFNITVFLRQGLRKSQNLSLMAISVSDLIEVVLQVWHNFCLNPFVENLEAPVSFIQVQYLTAGMPNGAAIRITEWVTTFMALERCLSIAMPLKIKQLITFKRTACIIILIYILNVSTLTPFYLSAYFSWNFNPKLNITQLGIAFRGNKLEMQGLVFLFHASLSVIPFLLVVIFTAILVVKLKQTSKWRKQVTHINDQNEAASARERKTVVLTIAVAIVLIVCYTPVVVYSITTAITPDFAITGRQANVYHAAFSFAFVLHSFNSSINVVVYYKMSSRYRQTFQELFFARKSRKGGQQQKKHYFSVKPFSNSL
nr:dermatopontin-like neuropeptides capa receptor-like P Cell adhesion/Resistant factor [Biomphalaria glabrata]